MENERKIVPELCFPGFDEPWVATRLGDVCEITNGKANAQDHIQNGKYPLFDRSEVIKASNEYILDCEAVIIPGEGMRFVPKYFKGKFNLHQRAYALKEFKIDSKFAYYFLEHNQKMIADKAVQSTVLSLRLPIIQNLIIHYPLSIIHSKKIASCLSSLDELISAHNDKRQALKDHKKGLMQNLFPPIGSSHSGPDPESPKTPNYRFPEFEKDGEWVVRKLGELGYFLGGGTPSKSNTEYWVGEIPWISSSDIFEDDIHNISISRFINENAINQSATKTIPKGSVLFVSRVGVGKLAINECKICTSQDFTSFVSESVHNYFIGYYFLANKHLLQSMNQGTSIKGFSMSDLENYVLSYPINPKEQQKIASCLSALDELITAQSEK